MLNLPDMKIRNIFNPNRSAELSRLIKETAIYGFGYVITNLSALFLLPLYLKYLSPAEYGLFSLAKAVPNLITSFITLGIHGAIVRFYYEWKKKNCEKEALYTVLLFMFFWVLISTALLLAFGKSIFGVLLKSVPFDPYLRIAVWTQAIGIVFFTLNHLARVKGQLVLYTVLNNVLFLLTVGFSVFFIAYLKMGVDGAMLGGLVANLLMLIPAAVIMFSNIRFKISVPALKESLAFCIPQLPGSFIGYFLGIADRFFLDKFVPLTQIGVYSLAKTVGSIVTMVTGIFQFCLIPFYMRIAAEREDHRFIIGRISRYFIYITALLALVITAFAPEIIYLLGKAQYAASAHYVGPLVLVSLIESVSLFPNVQIQLSKVMKYTSILAMINLAIFAAIGYILIPMYAIGGVIASYICTNSIVLSITLVIGRRLYPIPINAKRVAFAFFAVLLTGMGFIFRVSPGLLVFKIFIILVFIAVLVVMEFGLGLRSLFRRPGGRVI